MTLTGSILMAIKINKSYENNEVRKILFNKNDVSVFVENIHIDSASGNITHMRQEEPIKVQYSDICVIQENSLKGIFYHQSRYLHSSFQQYKNFQDEIEKILSKHF